MSQRRQSSVKLIDRLDEELSKLSIEEREEFLNDFHRQFGLKENEKEKENNSTVSRVCLLSGLLILQSASSFILQSFSDLISRHILITMYLTMLVGAGGNAGNQAAVLVIRRLATTKNFSIRSLVVRETIHGLTIATAVSLIGFVRVWIEERGAILPSITICFSLFAIVTSSIVLGTLLPIILHYVVHVDPAHAGPMIQVLMDILGVCITCAIGQVFLMKSPPHPHKEL